MKYIHGEPLDDSLTCRDIFGNMVRIPLEKMIFRNSVYGLIVHQDSLLVVRTRSTGLYAFPGGGIEMGEPIADALEREILEETGITVEMGKLAKVEEDFFYYNPGDEAYHAFLFFYWCKPLSTDLITDEALYDEESDSCRWVPITELTSEDFQIAVREVFKLVRASVND
jgi:8-oxo-dGTP diphosphatase